MSNGNGIQFARSHSEFVQCLPTLHEFSILMCVSCNISRHTIFALITHSMCKMHENIPIYMKFILKIVFHVVWCHRRPFNLHRWCCHTKSICTSCTKYWMNCFFFFTLVVSRLQTYSHFEILCFRISNFFCWFVACFCHLCRNILDLLLYYHSTDLFGNGFFSMFTTPNWNFQFWGFRSFVGAQHTRTWMQLIIFQKKKKTLLPQESIRFLAYLLCVLSAHIMSSATLQMHSKITWWALAPGKNVLPLNINSINTHKVMLWVW